MFQKILNNSKALYLIISTLLAHECFATADDKYPPILGLSATNSHSRNIAEIDLMLPILQGQNGVTIFDIKLKSDNQKSLESNLGLVYRHNFSDKAIFGIYGYFDRRKTQGNLVANQLTVGVDLLSTYIDGRLNLYIPDSKKKQLAPQNKTFVRNHTRVYVTQDGGVQERSLGGYDVEIGTPLFALFPKLDEQLGTKIYLANYKFSEKGVPDNSGVRLRAEQKIKDHLFSDRQSEIILHFGSSYTNRHKWNNFVALSFRVALSKDSSPSKRSKMQQRMMDVVVRDVDIVTQKAPLEAQILPVYWQGKEIHHMYFVGEKNDENYEGDGSYENPFSRTQLKKLVDEKKFQKKDTDLIIPIKTERALSDLQYLSLINECSAIDVKKHDSIILETADKTSFTIERITSYFPEFDRKQISKATLPLNDIEASGGKALIEPKAPAVTEELHVGDDVVVAENIMEGPLGDVVNRELQAGPRMPVEPENIVEMPLEEAANRVVVDEIRDPEPRPENILEVALENAANRVAVDEIRDPEPRPENILEVALENAANRVVVDEIRDPEPRLENVQQNNDQQRQESIRRNSQLLRGSMGYSSRLTTAGLASSENSGRQDQNEGAEIQPRSRRPQPPVINNEGQQGANVSQGDRNSRILRDSLGYSNRLRSAGLSTQDNIVDENVEPVQPSVIRSANPIGRRASANVRQNDGARGHENSDRNTQLLRRSMGHSHKTRGLSSSTPALLHESSF